MNITAAQKKKILERNPPTLIEDMQRVSEAMAYTSATSQFFRVRNMDIIKKASGAKIRYYVTDTIYVVGRLVLVIL